jgi:phosphatidylinositol alpha-mannosyltransferase
LLGTAFPINFGGGTADLVFNFAPASIEATLIKERFNVLHFHNATFPSFFQILLSPLTFKTLNILTLHSDISRTRLFKKIPQFFSFFINFCNLRIDGAIAVSPVALKALEKFKKPKIIIPNGVDLKVFNPQNPKIKKFKDKEINLLFVGRIEERKGLIYLLKAFLILKKKYQNLRLIVAGDGPEREKCENFVKENNLKDVLFLGTVKDELPSLYSSCDIFCAPSIYGESFGIVILEALASGLPVVGFANRGYKELLRGSIAEKFLAKPRDYRSLAKKFEILIENPKIREELRKFGPRHAQKYSWEKIAKKILNFYRICQKKKK